MQPGAHVSGRTKLRRLDRGDVSAYQWIQMLFALAVALLIAERVRALYGAALVSDEALRWLIRQLETGDTDHPRAWAEQRSATFVGRVLRAAYGDADTEAQVNECLLDLRDEAGARLRILRVCATLASTLGLLGGIIVLAGGSASGGGLSALILGATQRAAMPEAIATMAIGVATSAFCFQALALLRPAAQKALMQAQQIARLAAATARLR